MGHHNVIGFHLVEEPYGFLSNWWPARFVVGGEEYCCAEQYMMRRKCELFGDLSAAAVMGTSSPGQMQAIGRHASGFDAKVWDASKRRIVYEAALAKFSQDEALRARLVGTGSALLAECAAADRVWGIGMHVGDPGWDDPACWRVQNLLGYTLMAVRAVVG